MPYQTYIAMDEHGIYDELRDALETSCKKKMSARTDSGKDANKAQKGLFSRILKSAFDIIGVESRCSMTKKEREKLRKLVNKVQDGLPEDKTCECYDEDGNTDDQGECDLHYALRKLGDVADGLPLSEVG